MRFRLIWAGAVAAMLMTGQADAKGPKLPKQARQLIAMTPEDYASKVTIKNDSLETVATFDTSEGFQEKHGLLGIVWSDIMLRAFVEKTTGVTQYQVYFTFRGAASSWPHLSTVNYEGPNGLQSTEVKQLGSDVDCAGSNLMGGCTYTEVVAFEVPEDLLRKIAAGYTAGGMNAWRMRFKGQSGLDSNQFIMPAEAAGLLERVDQFKAANHLESEPSNPSEKADDNDSGG